VRRRGELTGFSKLTSKANQLAFLGKQGDVGALLEAEVTPRASPPAAASAAVVTPCVPDTSDIDAEISRLLEQRRLRMSDASAATP
jgi:hypothetical protein